MVIDMESIYGLGNTYQRPLIRFEPFSPPTFQPFIPFGYLMFTITSLCKKTLYHLLPLCFAIISVVEYCLPRDDSIGFRYNICCLFEINFDHYSSTI